MNEKEKLIDLMVECLIKADYSCEICNKSGFKCPVYIPEDTPMDFQPDFSKCIFKAKVLETLTTEHI